MPSTYSSALRLELIGDGEQGGTWGDTTNRNLGTLLEQAITGGLAVSVTAGNVTLTENDGLSDESRNAYLKFTGTPGAARNVIAPDAAKLYFVYNASDSTVTLKTTSNTGFAVGAGQYAVVYLYAAATAEGARFSSVSSAGVITAALTGNVTGNLTGNVTGNLTGNVTGNATNVSGVVAIANGGTNASTVADALTSLGLTPTFDYVTGRNYPPAYGGTGSGAVSNAVNRIWFVPWVQRETRAMASFNIKVTTGAAGNARIGIYTDSAGAPGALLVDAGTVSTTATGVKTLAYTTPIPIGIYWIAVHFEAAAACSGMTPSGSTASIILGLDAFPDGASAYTGWRSDAYSYASGLPASPSGLTGATSVLGLSVIA